MNNTKIIYASVIKLWSYPIAMLSGNNVTEFTDVKVSSFLHEDVSKSRQNQKFLRGRETFIPPTSNSFFVRSQYTHRHLVI